MTITATLIKATAANFTPAELQTRIAETLEKITAGERISSASTGAGASYTSEQTASNEDLLELYTAALKYKNGDAVELITGAAFNVCAAKLYI